MMRVLLDAKGGFFSPEGDEGKKKGGGAIKLSHGFERTTVLVGTRYFNSRFFGKEEKKNFQQI